jgi:hypothetical protein
MAIFHRGAYEHLIEVPSNAAAVEDERVFAWQLYVEMTFRPAVCGRLNLIGELVFEGEILMESLGSLNEFQTRVHELLGHTRLGSLTSDEPKCVAFAAAEMQEIVIRPFIDKWYVPYMHWWKQQERDHPLSTDFQRQNALDQNVRTAMFDDWSDLRQFSRSFCRELATTFRFVPLFDLVPGQIRREWMDECNQTWVAFGLNQTQTHDGKTDDEPVDTPVDET